MKTLERLGYRAAEWRLWIACHDLDTMAGWLRWQLALAKDWMTERPAFRAFLESLGWVLGIMVVDRITGDLPAVQTLYLIPVWWATLRTTRNFALSTVGIAALAASLCDSSGRSLSVWQQLANFVLNAGIYYVLMRGLDELESRFRRVSKQATHDPLTGAHNRLALEEFGRKACERAAATGEGLVLAIIDCDQFKALNDTYGHAFGDVVLTQLSRVLRRCVPNNAMVARLGGDEFVVAVPGRSLDWVERAVDLARHRLSASAALEGRPIDFSFGLSQWHVNRRTLSEILAAADENLYERKKLRAGVWYEIRAAVI